MCILVQELTVSVCCIAENVNFRLACAVQAHYASSERPERTNLNSSVTGYFCTDGYTAGVGRQRGGAGMSSALRALKRKLAFRQACLATSTDQSCGSTTCDSATEPPHQPVT
eukprot:6189405-Pleurochrysis_carterae.AAC.1